MLVWWTDIWLLLIYRVLSYQANGSCDTLGVADHYIFLNTHKCLCLCLLGIFAVLHLHSMVFIKFDYLSCKVCIDLCLAPTVLEKSGWGCPRSMVATSGFGIISVWNDSKFGKSYVKHQEKWCGSITMLSRPSHVLVNLSLRPFVLLILLTPDHHWNGFPSPT